MRVVWGNAACHVSQNIESSLNKNKVLGSTSIGVLYLVNIFVSYAAKNFVARENVGPKRAMVLGAAQYVVFSAANLYATWLENALYWR